MVRRSVCPAAVNVSPGGGPGGGQALGGGLAPCCRCGDQGGQDGQPFAGPRVHPGLAAVRDLAWLISPALTGQGAAHGPHRAGSSIAHWAMSR